MVQNREVAVRCPLFLDPTPWWFPPPRTSRCQSQHQLLRVPALYNTSLSLSRPYPVGLGSAPQAIQQPRTCVHGSTSPLRLPDSCRQTGPTVSQDLPATRPSVIPLKTDELVSSAGKERMANSAGRECFPPWLTLPERSVPHPWSALPERSVWRTQPEESALVDAAGKRAPLSPRFPAPGVSSPLIPGVTPLEKGELLSVGGKTRGGLYRERANSWWCRRKGTSFLSPPFLF